MSSTYGFDAHSPERITRQEDSVGHGAEIDDEAILWRAILESPTADDALRHLKSLARVKCEQLEGGQGTA